MDGRRMTRIAVSGLLWDRVVDSLSQDYPDLDLGRRGQWQWRDVGFGRQASAEVPEATARDILRYFDSVSRIDGSGMDPEGAADARKEARAAASAARAIRKQLEG